MEHLEKPEFDYNRLALRIHNLIGFVELMEIGKLNVDAPADFKGTPLRIYLEMLDTRLHGFLGNG